MTRFRYIFYFCVSTGLKFHSRYTSTVTERRKNYSFYFSQIISMNSSPETKTKKIGEGMNVEGAKKTKKDKKKKEKKDKKEKKEKKERKRAREEEELEVKEEIEQEVSIPSEISHRNNSFANLMYGLSPRFIQKYTKTLFSNDYNNEKKFSHDFLEASKGNREKLLSLLILFSFSQVHAEIIADRILSFSGLN